MALINIEYGSLASSETMNNNFMYLDDKIAETSDSVMTSISSILSNIATINTRLNEISENTNDSLESLSATLEDYKTKTKILVKTASMIPDWANYKSISLSSKYTVTSNGYVLIFPETTSSGNLVVNGKSIVFKAKNSSYDHAAQLVAMPVSKGDTISCTASLSNAYFVPTKDVSIEEF